MAFGILCMIHFQKCKYDDDGHWEHFEGPDDWVPSLKVECLEAPFPWTDGETQDRAIILFTPWYEAVAMPGKR